MIKSVIILHSPVDKEHYIVSREGILQHKAPTVKFFSDCAKMGFGCKKQVCSILLRAIFSCDKQVVTHSTIFLESLIETCQVVDVIFHFHSNANTTFTASSGSGQTEQVTCDIHTFTIDDIGMLKGCETAEQTAHVNKARELQSRHLPNMDKVNGDIEKLLSSLNIPERDDSTSPKTSSLFGMVGDIVRCNESPFLPGEIMSNLHGIVSE